MPTFTAHSAIGQREDLTDIIYNISPTETPFMSSIGKTKATAVYHEWQTDSLAAATTANAAIEGADATSATLSPTVRLGTTLRSSRRLFRSPVLWMLSIRQAENPKKRTNSLKHPAS